MEEFYRQLKESSWLYPQEKELIDRQRRHLPPKHATVPLVEFYHSFKTTSPSLAARAEDICTKAESLVCENGKTWAPLGSSIPLVICLGGSSHHHATAGLIVTILVILVLSGATFLVKLLYKLVIKPRIERCIGKRATEEIERAAMGLDDTAREEGSLAPLVADTTV